MSYVKYVAMILMSTAVLSTVPPVRADSEITRTTTEDLDDVAAQATKFRKDGVLTAAKTRILAIKLDRVESKLDNDVAEINIKRSKMGLRAD